MSNPYEGLTLAEIQGKMRNKDGELILTILGLPHSEHHFPLALVAFNQVLVEWAAKIDPRFSGLSFTEMVDHAKEFLECKIDKSKMTKVY